MNATIEQEGRYYKIRVGERSHMNGVYTTRTKAEKALKCYESGVAKKQEKRVNKKVTKNAKKTTS